MTDHPFAGLPDRGKEPTSTRTFDAWIQQAQQKTGVAAGRVGLLLMLAIAIAPSCSTSRAAKAFEPIEREVRSIPFSNVVHEEVNVQSACDLESKSGPGIWRWVETTFDPHSSSAVRDHLIGRGWKLVKEDATDRYFEATLEGTTSTIVVGADIGEGTETFAVRGGVDFRRCEAE